MSDNLDKLPEHVRSRVAAKLAETPAAQEPVVPEETLETFLASGGDIITGGISSDTSSIKKRKIKLSETEEEEIEDSDEALAKILKDARAKADIEAKMKALHDETEGVRKKSEAEIDAAKRWKDWEAKSKQEKLDILFEGGMDAYKKQVIEEYVEYAKLTEAERKAFDNERARTEALQKMQEMEAKLSKQQKDVEDARNRAIKEERDSLYRRVFREHSFLNPEKDGAIEGVNKLIYADATASLSTLISSGANITEAVLQREFSAAKQKYGRLVPQKQATVKEQIDEQLAANKGASVVPGATQPATNQGDKDTIRRWAELRKAGKMTSIIKEVQASPDKMSLYEKFVTLISGKKW
jgi:hypothetical protein